MSDFKEYYNPAGQSKQDRLEQKISDMEAEIEELKQVVEEIIQAREEHESAA